MISGLMGKGEDTNLEILRAGVREASRIGLTQLTIGGLATTLDMSKSGLYAHFGSKEKTAFMNVIRRVHRSALAAGDLADR